MSGFPLLYNIYTHIYTHIRIKETRSIRYSNIQHVFSILLHATGIKVNSSPHSEIGGEELTNKQIELDVKHFDKCKKIIRFWKCLLMQKQVKNFLKTKKNIDNKLKKRFVEISSKGWVVVVSDDAIIDPGFGWICDCGCWTMGNDKQHVPIVNQIGIVKKGVVRNCVRK